MALLLYNLKPTLHKRLVFAGKIVGLFLSFFTDRYSNPIPLLFDRVTTGLNMNILIMYIMYVNPLTAGASYFRVFIFLAH